MLTEEITLRLVKEIKRFLLEDALALSRSSDEQLMVRIKEIIDHKLVHYEITPQEREKIARRVFSSLRGLGILDELLNDDSITEIMINGPENIFVEKDGQIYRYRRQFESEQHLLDIIQRIVGEAGKEVNQANPIVDTRIQKDGSRVNVVLPPISLAGPVVTIRKFSKKPMTVEKLLEYGSITPEVADFLQKLVRAKYNIFISGGTGSGKTTFLNALSNFIPGDERIITIEDSAELQIRNISNLVSLETRNANTSGRGEITIRDLIRSALRMRPERIIVGEVRGAEALDMLQAMNTGRISVYRSCKLYKRYAKQTGNDGTAGKCRPSASGDTATDFLRTGHCNPLVETQGQVPKNDGDYRNSGMQRRRIPVESAICFSGNTGQYAS